MLHSKKNMKKRSLSTTRFGIEIEVEFKDVKESLKLIQKKRIIPGWFIDEDPSLLAGAEYRALDSNKLYYTKDSIDQIKEVLGLIKAHNGFINYITCAAHVHIDMTNYSEQEILNILKNFYLQQNDIYKKFKVVKHRERKHAAKLPIFINKDLTIELIKKVRKGRIIRNCPEYLDSRRFGVNLLSLGLHNTLEFRIFNGTISIRRIKEYIKWAIEFCIENAKKDVA